jgi:hypothetical protein
MLFHAVLLWDGGSGQAGWIGRINLESIGARRSYEKEEEDSGGSAKPGSVSGSVELDRKGRKPAPMR